MLNYPKKTTKTKKTNTVFQKLFLSLFLLFLFRLGNTIPLSGIDQEDLKKALDNRNSLMQVINMYSSGGSTLLTPFSLGIIPFINASIIFDLCTALFPFLEKLQSEGGELGRKKLLFYKKLLTLLLSVIQAGFLVFYLKSYFFNTELSNLLFTGFQLVTGSMMVVWITEILDKKGIGSGTSLIIFTNIVISLLSKISIAKNSFDLLFFFEVLFFIILIVLICLSQTARANIQVVSARQLVFLQNLEKEKKKSPSKLNQSFNLKNNTLTIKFNQAGIFPIIIASNLMGFFPSELIKSNSILYTLTYYFLIIGFNYFYTVVFWDPEKISEQLRKASVSILNVSPGKETFTYLENLVKSTSLVGGLFLCMILFFYDCIKQIVHGYFLDKLNVSSLIILVGVAYEIQKNLRGLAKNTPN